jgi:SHAQKYF class myb-like DNA-binding protein
VRAIRSIWRRAQLLHVERMSSSSSAAADCDSLSSPARRRTSSRPKRGLHSKLGTHGSGNGNGSSSDEVEQDDKRRRSSRFVWTADLHRRFEDAVQRLGLKSAEPEAIRQLMGVDSESDVHTRKRIKSHLQKYRAAHCCREAVEQSTEKQLVMQEDFLDVLETNGETSLLSTSLEAPAATDGLHPSIFTHIDKNKLAQVAGWREADAADIDSDVDNLPAHSFFEMLGTSSRSVGDSSLVRVQTSTEATSVQTSTEAKDGPPLPTSQLPEVTHDLKASAKAASEWRQLERVQASPIRTFVAATASQASPTSPPSGTNVEKSASSPAPKTTITFPATSELAFLTPVAALHLRAAAKPPPPCVVKSPNFACSILSEQYQATLTQLPTHTEVDEQLERQGIDLALLAGILAAQSNATRGPIMSTEQVTRLAQYVVIQRNLLQHMCRMLHAQHLDAAHCTAKATSLFAAVDSP